MITGEMREIWMGTPRSWYRWAFQDEMSSGLFGILGGIKKKVWGEEKHTNGSNWKDFGEGPIKEKRGGEVPTDWGRRVLVAGMITQKKEKGGKRTGNLVRKGRD